jgi:hypothetical protein
MATASEKAQCVYWYDELRKSAVTVQRNYRLVYQKTPPSVNYIKNWCEKFLNTGSVLDSKLPGCPSTSDDTEHCQSQQFFTPAFNGVDTRLCFSVNSTVITLNGYR